MSSEIPFEINYDITTPPPEMLYSIIDSWDKITYTEHFTENANNIIKSRFTVLKRLDGVEVVIPNESWISENIINYTYSDRKTKVPLDIQISYSSSVDKAFEIILTAVKNESRVLDNPAPQVFLKEFNF